MKISERIKEKRKALGLTQKQVADYFGISSVSVSEWERGIGKPDQEKLPGLARLLKTTVNFLLTGKDDYATNQNQASYANVEPGPETRGDVPVISWVQAGTWCAVADPFEPGISDEWLPCPVRHGSKAFALRVRGLSMENPTGKYSYSDGDIIYIDPDKQAENGSRVIVRLEDQKEATFKQLVIEGDRKYLRALNPSWPEQFIEINGNATICGVVIGKWVPE